jgi:hypothetical protein
MLWGNKHSGGGFHHTVTQTGRQARTHLSCSHEHIFRSVIYARNQKYWVINVLLLTTNSESGVPKNKEIRSKFPKNSLHALTTCVQHFGTSSTSNTLYNGTCLDHLSSICLTQYRFMLVEMACLRACKRTDFPVY